MPTYEYICKSCRYKFEKFQNIKDVPIKKCPRCGKELKRVIVPEWELFSKGKGSITRITGIAAFPAEPAAGEPKGVTDRHVRMMEPVRDNEY